MKANPDRTSPVLAHSDIVSLLPRLRASGSSSEEKSADPSLLLAIGALFETPVKIPNFGPERFPYMPPFIRRSIRTVYGLVVLIHEKLSANKNAAFFMLLEELYRRELYREGQTDRYMRSGQRGRGKQQR